MDYLNKKFTLEDGKTYLVIEQVYYEEGIYLYIVNPEDESDSRFVEIKDGNLLPIDANLFDKEIWPLFLEKIRN